MKHLRRMMLLFEGVIFILVSMWFVVSCSSQEFTSAPCQGLTLGMKGSLQSSKTSIEGALARKRMQLEAGDRTKVSDREKLRRDIRELEVDIIDLIYKLDCFREDWETVRGGGQFVEITNYYATNRHQTGANEPASFYSSGDTRVLQYGRTTITIPSAMRWANWSCPHCGDWNVLLIQRNTL
jgi:hypothetical protein